MESATGTDVQKANEQYSSVRSHLDTRDQRVIHKYVIKQKPAEGGSVSKQKAVFPVVAVSPVDPANILAPSELADRLKVSDRWIYEKSRSRNKNPLPVLRLGRYLRFDWLAVSAWMREQGGVS